MTGMDCATATLVKRNRARRAYFMRQTYEKIIGLIEEATELTEPDRDNAAILIYLLENAKTEAQNLRDQIRINQPT